MADKNLAKALHRLTDEGFIAKEKAIDAFPEFNQVRDAAVATVIYLINTRPAFIIAKVIEQGGQVHWAPMREANAIIDKICREKSKIDYQSKSMVGEEIGLNDYLIEHGYVYVKVTLANTLFNYNSKLHPHCGASNAC